MLVGTVKSGKEYRKQPREPDYVPPALVQSSYIISSIKPANTFLSTLTLWLASAGRS